MIFLLNLFFSFIYILVMLCAFVYLTIPFIVRFLPSIVVQGTFLNLVCSPKLFSCLHKPKEAWKLDGVKHYYLKSNGGKLGVWHIFPAVKDGSLYKFDLSSAEKIFLYCHGNAWHRSFGHRRCLYMLLRNHGFHVITFDYRGYGDSDGWPSEKGVIDDTLTVYNWVVEQVQVPNYKIFVWGHSLGTSIAAQAVHRIEESDCLKLPSGVVLEAPFTSAVDAMAEYPLSKNLVRLYPGNLMKKLFEKALSTTHIYFSTVNVLPKLNCNVLILHAEDDRKVNFKLGKKLFDETKKNQGSSLKVIFAAFKASHGFGHNGIWQHPSLPLLIENLSQDFLNDQFVEIEL